MFSQLNLSSVTVFSPANSVSYTFSIDFFFYLCFLPPLFRVFYNLLTKGVFYTHNTSFPLALLSLSFLFLLSLFFSSPLFSVFFFPCLPFLSLSLSGQIFGAATAAMPHRFRRAWLQKHVQFSLVKMELDPFYNELFI